MCEILGEGRGCAKVMTNLDTLTVHSLTQIDNKDLLSPYHQEDLEDGQPILYPLHYGVAVTEATFADTIPDHIVQRRMHVQSLHEKSGG